MTACAQTFAPGEIWGICLPTVEQELLLRACLGTEHEVLDAWNQWSARVDLSTLDRGSQRLLPLLYRNLKSLSVQHSWIGKMRGMYRATWYKNNLLFNAMARVLSSFHDAGIETMILKGVAVTLDYYRDKGLRPMSDADILIPPHKAKRAVALLADLGWLPQITRQADLIDSYFSDAHGCSFLNSEGLNLDLHGHLLEECCYKGADDSFWAASFPAKVQHVPTRTPHPTDLLLHVCVHGGKWNEIPTVRWVADAITILNTSSESINWNRLVNEARKRLLVIPVRESLTYLRERHRAPIPLLVLNELNYVHASDFERKYHWMRSRIQKPWMLFMYDWYRYRRNRILSCGSQSQGGVIGFARYLQRVWALKHVWQVPLMAFDAVRRKIWQDRGRYLRRLTSTLSSGSQEKERSLPPR